MWRSRSFHPKILLFLALVISSSYGWAKDCYPIKSLHSIYKSGQGVKPKVMVGLIGSGLDYNHPGIAKFIAIRQQMETALQKVEESPEVTQMNSCEYQKFQQSRKIGFPRWMDQALGSPWPTDQIFKDGNLLPNQYHETRIGSRIIFGRDDIALHFARRMFGSKKDVFNATQVIKNFSEQGVQIVNMSFGSACGALAAEEKSWSQLFKTYSHMIFVISAGNSGRNLDYFEYCPAKFSRDNANVISVTSVASDGALSINYDPEVGQDVLVNYGDSVDLGIRADNLSVLAPYQHNGEWVTLPLGWTSHAAAEVTRVIAHAMADGYRVQAQQVKQQLINTSRPSRLLQDFIKSSGEVDETAFRASLGHSTDYGPQ